MQRTTLSVGPALRKVREARGLTLEEAARDTRVRLEFLEAIEAEDFHLLLGDVHLRGCLRTYATYLRLSPDKVVAVYESDRAPHDEVVVVASTGPHRTRPGWAAPSRRPPPVDPGGRDRARPRRGVRRALGPPPCARRPRTCRRRPARRSRPPRSAARSASRSSRAVPSRSRSWPTAATPRVFELESDEGRSFDASGSITIRLSEGATARDHRERRGLRIRRLDAASRGRTPTATTSRRRREADHAREGRDRRGRDRAADRADRQHERAVDLGATRRARHRRAASPGRRGQRGSDRGGDLARGLQIRRRDRDRRARADAGRCHEAGPRGGGGRAARPTRGDRGHAPRPVPRPRSRHARVEPRAGGGPRGRPVHHPRARHRAGAGRLDRRGRRCTRSPASPRRCGR